MTAQIMMNDSIPLKPSLEAGKWQVLRPPIQSDNGIEVGVVEVHPALHNRVVYTTRSRAEQSNIGEELIVIQDFNESRHSSNPVANADGDNVIACFSLDELVACLNDFQTTHSHQKEELPLLSINAISSWADPITVQSLGAVQHLSFLDREAIRTSTAPGYVKDRPSTDGIYKIMIGFRRCIISVTLFKSKDQRESYARGISIQAYIGPDDFDDCDGASKAKKKLAASFAIPISEHIVAFGCYDGGVRFYDLLQRKYVKSALGPNGRSNPVLRVMNANAIIDSGDVTPQTVTPKIICACASGVAYLWELDLSVDVMTGEIVYFNIPPPTACFDGMVAAVSGKGLPVVRHPSLSPSSIASLSPASSWEHTDTINAQFEIAYDPHRDIMFWNFSPDCVGASLLRHASTEERLDSNGSLVAWNLSKLPPKQWPPPVAAPCCVVPMLRTETGRVTSHMVVPGILNGTVPNSVLSTVYVTSSCEIVTAVMDMKTKLTSVQRNVCSIVLSDLKEMKLGDIYSVTASRMQPSLIAMGTKYGVLMAKIYRSNGSKSRQLTTIREGTDGSVSTCSTDIDVWSLDPSHKQLHLDGDRITHPNELHARLSELKNKNRQLESELEETFSKSQASMKASEQKESELRAQMTTILEQQQQFCDSTKDELQTALKSIESLQSALEAKEELCAEMEDIMESLREELGAIKSKLQGNEDNIENTQPHVAEAGKAIEILEMRLASKNQYCETLQEEINTLKLAKKGGEDIDGSVYDDASQIFDKEIEDLREKEESLRNYVLLLEEDKAQLDKELEGYKQKFDNLHNDKTEFQLTINEQGETLKNLMDLLDTREKEHEEKITRCDQKASILASKYEELEGRLKVETEIAMQSEEKMIATESVNVHLKKENTRLENEAMQKQALYNAMKYELQNALNELAIYEQARSSKMDLPSASLRSQSAQSSGALEMA